MGLPSASLNMQKQIDLTMENKDVRKNLKERLDNCILYEWKGGFEQEYFIEHVLSLLLTQRKELREAIKKLPDIGVIGRNTKHSLFKDIISRESVLTLLEEK